MIVRSIHAKNYVVINKKALEDPNLSFKAKGLWAYCLSRPDNWQFHVSHLASVSCEGEKAIYSALKELNQNGYCLHGRIKDSETGYFTSGNYVILEQQNTKEEIEKLKKELPNWVFDPQPQKGDDGKGDDGKEALLSTKEQPSIEKEINTLVPTPKTEVETKVVPPFSNESLEIAQELWKRVVSIHPKAKPPKMEQWAKEVDLTIRRDKRHPQELRSMIEYCFDKDPFWINVIQSPDGLRRNFDKIWPKMCPASNNGTWIAKNRALAYELKSYFKNFPEKIKIIHVTGNELIRSDTNEILKYDQDPNLFKTLMENTFGVEV